MSESDASRAVMAHLGYGAAWLSFGLLHSLLARGAGAALLQRLFGAWERLAYNGIAVVHLLVVLLFGHWLLGDQASFARPGWLAWLQWCGLAFGLLVGFRALGSYDLGLFAGTRQLREARTGVSADEDEPLATRGLHRYVRHPLYSALFLCLWGLVHDPLSLATAVWGSLYTLIGTYFEERKLISLYGEAYRTYRHRVPAFFPWKGRAI